MELYKEIANNLKAVNTFSKIVRGKKVQHLKCCIQMLCTNQGWFRVTNFAKTFMETKLKFLASNPDKSKNN